MRAVILMLATAPAVAHPGHGEAFHAHPELWLAALLVGVVAAWRAR